MSCQHTHAPASLDHSWLLGNVFVSKYAHLEEVQEGWLGHAGLLDEGHGVGEVVHVVAVDVQHHGLGELDTETHVGRTALFLSMTVPQRLLTHSGLQHTYHKAGLCNR